jgi:hypothetical protein
VAYLGRGAIVPVALVLIGCAACGSSTSSPAAPSSSSAPSTSAKTEAALTPDQVPAAIKAAFEAAGAVHVKGSVTESGNTLKLDVQLNKDSSGGTISVGSTEIPLRHVGDKYYFQYTSALLQQAGLTGTAADALKDKWVSSDSKIAAGLADGFKDFFDYEAFEKNTATPTGALTASGTDTVNGTPVSIFTDTDGSTLDLATSSPHYVIRNVGPKTSPGSFDFTGWGQAVPVAAPTAAELYSGPGA